MASSPIEPALYVILVEATAGDHCEHPAGAALKILVVAQGDDEQAAHDRALRVLHQHGWIVAEVKRQAPLTDIPQEDGYLRNAVLAALEHGAQIVVYDR